MQQHISDGDFTVRKTLQLPSKYALYQEDASISAMSHSHKNGTNMLPSEMP